MPRSRIIGAVLAGVLAFTSAAHATLRLYDPFEYPATPASPATGDRGLDGTVGTIVTAGGYPTGPLDPGTTQWFPTNAQTTNYFVGAGGGVGSASGSLSYPGLPASIGNSASHTGGIGHSPRRGFYGAPDFDASGNATGLISSTSDGSLFYSFLLRLDALPGTTPDPTSGGIGAMVTYLNLTQGYGTGNPSANPASVWVRNDGAGGFKVGVSKGQFTPPNAEQYGAASYAVGSTLLVVAEYDFVANVNPNVREGNDVCRLWVNPTSLGGVSPLVADAVATGANSGLDIGLGPPPPPIQSVGIRRQHANLPALTIDELRVGDTYADVTPVPEPAIGIAALGICAAGVGRRRGRQQLSSLQVPHTTGRMSCNVSVRERVSCEVRA
jgi:hypothetical protein